jgi:hypothetical protein
MAIDTHALPYTARYAVERWVSQLEELFHTFSLAAAAGRWSATQSEIERREDPFWLGASLTYKAPLLILKRADPVTGEEQRVTFEPRHRFALGTPGRIDVYSFPRLREAMLFRVVDAANAADLTWEQAEALVAQTPWKAYSSDRLPLEADLSTPAGLLAFLESLVR